MEKESEKNIETIYIQLKKEESKFCEMAQSLGLNYSILGIDNTEIKATIEQIKNNTSNNLETIVSQYSEELKRIFEKSFNEKIQKMIKKSKTIKLEQEKEYLKREKVSLLGKILGKEKLKQARIKNVELRMQLLASETNNKNETYSIDDSLSDLYAYFQSESEKTIIPEIQQFLDAVKTNKLLNEMINEEEINELYREKVKKQKEKKQLIENNKNNKSNNIQIENNRILKQIQSNRARTLTKQNMESIQTEGALNKFQNMLNEIKKSINEQSKEETEQTVEIENEVSK